VEPPIQRVLLHFETDCSRVQNQQVNVSFQPKESLSLHRERYSNVVGLSDSEEKAAQPGLVVLLDHQHAGLLSNDSVNYVGS
jgi:hypothetical protein